MAGISPLESNYVILPFNSRRIGDKLLVSNITGAWIFLDNTQFELLKAHRVQEDEVLFHSLLSSGIISVPDDFKFLKDRLKNRFWHLSNGTSLHVIALTNECNLACKYCYAPSKNKIKMSEKTAKDLVKFVFQSPSKSHTIEFSGGEPLLNFEAIKVLVSESRKRAKETNKEVNFAMIHNGTKWDEEKFKFFVDNNIGVCFSLDGPKDLHDKHRPRLGGGGSYDEVIKWIKRFRKENFRSLNATPVITKYSLGREKEIIDEYLSLGFRTIRFKYLSYFGRAVSIWDELGYTPEEFLEAWKKVIEYMFELNKRGVFVIEGITQILAKKIFLSRDPGFCELQMPCGAGLGQLAYSPNGDVYTCDEGRMFEEFKLGNVKEKYSDLLKSDLLKEMVIASSGFTTMCENCVYKPFCGTCPLESYKAEGTLYSKMSLNRRCKIHKGMLDFLFKRMQKDIQFKKMLKDWASVQGFKEYKINVFKGDNFI